MTNFDRAVLDFSVLSDSVELEFDNNCHFLDISAAYEAEIMWRKSEQIVYAPVYGTNLENDNPSVPRDISLWDSTKYIEFVTHNISMEIWAPYRETFNRVIHSEVAQAYCNLVPPNCAVNAATLAASDLEVISVEVENPTPTVGTTYHAQLPVDIHKPKRADSFFKRPVIFLIPGNISAGSSFDDIDYIAGVSLANSLTSRGYVVVHWDAEGRGAMAPQYCGPYGVKSLVKLDGYSLCEGGEEDYNGQVHQDGLAAIVRYVLDLPYVDTNSVGFIAFDFGLSMLTGMLSRNPDINNIAKYIIDYEGLTDREDIAGCGHTYGTTIQHDCTDDAWWAIREPMTAVSTIKARWCRIQFELVDPLWITKIYQFLNTLMEGSCPWVRLDKEEINHHYSGYENVELLPSSTYIIRTLNDFVYDMHALGPVYVPLTAHVNELPDSFEIDITETLSFVDDGCFDMLSGNKIPSPSIYGQYQTPIGNVVPTTTLYDTPFGPYSKRSAAASTKTTYPDGLMEVAVSDIIYGTDSNHAVVNGTKIAYTYVTYTPPTKLFIRPQYWMKTFIDAIKPYGYTNAISGTCDFPEGKTYLCYGRCLPTFISTLMGSSKNRLKHNINALLMSEVSQRGYPFSPDFGTVINNNVLALKFSDEFQQLDGTYRRFSKHTVNIRAWKPLSYSLRMAPDNSTINPIPLQDTTSIVNVTRNNIVYHAIEFPAEVGQTSETLPHMINYSVTNPIPAGDVFMTLIPSNQAAADNLMLLNLKMSLFQTGKLPICTYNNLPNPATVNNVVLPSSFHDSFDGNDGDAPSSDLWTLNKPTGCTVAIENNMLHYTATGTGAYPNVTSNFMLVGNFDIQIDYANPVVTSAAGSGIEIKIQSEDAIQQIYFKANKLDIGNSFETGISLNSGGSWTTPSHRITRTNGFGKLRLVRNGNSVYSYYSDGYGAWTLLFTYTNFTTTKKIKVLLAVWNQSGTSSGDIDNFVINSGTVYSNGVTTLTDSTQNPTAARVITINTPNVIIPLGTMGWGMRQKFTLMCDQPIATPDAYKYNVQFTTMIPTVFGDAGFSDFFGFTNYIDTMTLQINVR